jgi:nardilysin
VSSSLTKNVFTEKLDEEEEKIETKHRLEASSSTADKDEEEMEEEEEEGSESDEDGEEGSCDEEEEDDDSGEAPAPSKRSTMEATGLKMSAAGLCVHMGSFSDPPDIPGLAHFLGKIQLDELES